MYGTSGIVSATSFYGDGSNPTGVVGLVSVTNILFVTPDGDDTNDGYLVSTAKRTVGSYHLQLRASTVIKVVALVITLKIILLSYLNKFQFRVIV